MRMVYQWKSWGKNLMHEKGELRKRLDEAKRHEEDLENELANMQVLVAKLRKSGTYSEESSSEGVHASISLQTRGGNESSSNGFSKKILNVDEMCEKMDDSTTFEELEARYIKERRRCKELESLISKLKGEDVVGLDITTLDELQNLHVEAITKICHAKCSNHLLQHFGMKLLTVLGVIAVKCIYVQSSKERNCIRYYICSSFDSELN